MLLKSLIYILYLLFFCNNVSEAIVSQELKLYDQSSVVLSLKDYNIYNPNGESVESTYTVSPNSTITISITDIPKNVHFVMMQAHSYLLNVTLSYDSIPSINNSITGTNTGLVKMKEMKNLSFYLIYNNSNADVNVLFAIQAYGVEAPIPGGCNMEFQLEVSPFLKVIYTDDITEVQFAPAAPPETGLPNSILYSNNECNIKPSVIEHFMYYRYFPERDFSNKTYFNIIKSFMTKSRIQKHGVLARNKLSLSPLRRIFASYTGTGNAFVVVSRFGNQSAVYVPSFTYSCNYLEKSSTCYTPDTMFTKILSAVVLIMGFITCFFGLLFFRFSTFLFTTVLSTNIIHTLFSLIFSIDLYLSVRVSLGLSVSIMFMLAKIILKYPMMPFIIMSICFGFLLASIILYGIIDNFEFFVSDLNFWCIFIALVIAFFLKSFIFKTEITIIGTSFFGSFLVVAVIDYFIGSNIRFIFVNTIRRATISKFKWAIIGPPFQLYDILLCLTWIMLSVAGVFVQRFPLKINQNKSLSSYPTERTFLIPS